MKPIVHIPEPVLAQPAKTVTSFDKKLHQLITEMTKTLKATKRPKGVGLAAPQIGVGLRVFLTMPTTKSPVRAFINPEIIAKSEPKTDVAQDKDADSRLEGCLSIPDIWGHVSRSPSVTLHFQDELGQSHEEVFDGFLATIIQHETDHTNGILFTQRVIEQKGKFFHSHRDKLGKEILEEITLG